MEKTFSIISEIGSFLFIAALAGLMIALIVGLLISAPINALSISFASIIGFLALGLIAMKGYESVSEIKYILSRPY